MVLGWFRVGPEVVLGGSWRSWVGPECSGSVLVFGSFLFYGSFLSFSGWPRGRRGVQGGGPSRREDLGAAVRTVGRTEVVR